MAIGKRACIGLEMQVHSILAVTNQSRYGTLEMVAVLELPAGHRALPRNTMIATRPSDKRLE
jgi:hypothetical protein